MTIRKHQSTLSSLVALLALAAIHAAPQRAHAQAVAPAADVEQAGDEKPEKEKEEAKKLQQLELAEGSLTLSLPAAWKKIKPRNFIIQHEFAVPPAKDEKTPGRLTLMSASGSVQANIDRWIGQFNTVDGKPLTELQKQADGKYPGSDQEGYIKQEIKGEGVKATLVDLRGTYHDRPRGPRGPSVELPGYRMFGLIIPTEKHGTWFVKFYGPKKTIDAAAKDFRAMVESAKYAP